MSQIWTLKLVFVVVGMVVAMVFFIVLIVVVIDFVIIVFVVIVFVIIVIVHLSKNVLYCPFFQKSEVPVSHEG